MADIGGGDVSSAIAGKIRFDVAGTFLYEATAWSASKFRNDIIYFPQGAIRFLISPREA